MSKFYTYIVLFVVLLFSIAPINSFAQRIRVQGEVKDMTTNQGLMGVSIVHDGIYVGTSNEDGKFAISVPSNAELLFYRTGYNDIKLKLNNRQLLEVIMSEQVIEIGEVLVVAKMSKKKIVVDQTDIDIIGNNFYLKTKFRIPKQVFSNETRFIVQPTLYDATKKEYKHFRPVVIDGNMYIINKLRVHEFDESKDSLLQYVVNNDLVTMDYIYPYKDSLFIDKKDFDNDFRAECYLSVNGVFERPKIDYLDTVIIARGTRNPLRFLDYKFESLPLTDSAYIPKPEMKLLSETGVSRIGFLIGQAVIDPNNPDNEMELNAIYERINSILDNEYMTMQSIDVKGFASPDGSYASNLKLAGKRTDVILKEIEKSLKGKDVSFIKMTSSSKVEPWSKLADNMYNDSLAVAMKLYDIVDEYKDNIDNCQFKIRRMPEYNTPLFKDYLSKLRRTEYTLNFSLFRNLKDHEIIERYNSGEPDISRFEMWRLIESAKTEQEKEKFEQLALAKYPNFTLIANRVVEKLLLKDSLNLSILEPCLKNNPPFEVVFNQSLVALGLNEYELADSLVATLPLNNYTSYLKGLLSMLNGHYDEAYPLVVSKGGLNEVLLLLCMENNKDAYDKIGVLLEDPANTKNAKMWYVRAICANRIDDLFWGMEAMKRALELDPSLLEIAKLDSDVMDILEILEPIETEEDVELPNQTQENNNNE